MVDNGETSSETPSTSKETTLKVYLFTFPPCPHVYSVSPFALKVESFLRLHEIPHEVVYTLFPGSKKTVPYARIGCKYTGEEVPDSNIMIPRFKKEFGVDKDAALSPEELAVSHAVLRMVEEHTAHMGFYYRYGLHIDEFYPALEVPQRFFNADKWLLGKVFCMIISGVSSRYSVKKMKFRGLAQHTDEEKWEFSNEDLRAISNYLGEKEWFFGGKGPTTVDCVLFGHLSQFLYIPLDFPQKKFLRDECPNVTQYIHRFRDRYWPDWEEKCKRVDLKLDDFRAPERDKGSGCGRKPKIVLSIAVVTGALLWAYARKAK